MELPFTRKIVAPGFHTVIFIVTIVHAIFVTPAFSIASHSTYSGFSEPAANPTQAPDETDKDKDKEKDPKKLPPTAAEEAKKDLDAIADGDEEIKGALEKAIEQARKEFKGKEEDKDAYIASLLKSARAMDKSARALSKAGEGEQDFIVSQMNPDDALASSYLLSLMPKSSANKEKVKEFNDRHFTAIMSIDWQNISSGDPTKGAKDLAQDNGKPSSIERLSTMPPIVGKTEEGDGAAKPAAKTPGFFETTLSPFRMGVTGAALDSGLKVVTDALQPTIDKASSFLSGVMPKTEVAHNNGGETPPGEAKPASNPTNGIAKSESTVTTASEPKPAVQPTTESTPTHTSSNNSSGASSSATTETQPNTAPPNGIAISTGTSTPDSNGIPSTSNNGTTLSNGASGSTAANTPDQKFGAAGNTGGFLSMPKQSGGALGAGNEGDRNSGSSSNGGGTFGHSGGATGPSVPSAIANDESSKAPNQASGTRLSADGNRRAPQNSTGTSAGNSDNSVGTYASGGAVGLPAALAPSGSLPTSGNPGLSNSFFANLFPSDKTAKSAGNASVESAAGANLSPSTGGPSLLNQLFSPAQLAGGETGDAVKDNALNSLPNNSTDASGVTASNAATAGRVAAGNIPVITSNPGRGSRVKTIGDMLINKQEPGPAAPSDNTSVSAQIAAAEAAAKAAERDISIPMPSTKTAYLPSREVRTVPNNARTTASDDESPREATFATILTEPSEAVKNNPWNNLTKTSGLARTSAPQPEDEISKVVSRAFNGVRDLDSGSSDKKGGASAYRPPPLREIGLQLHEALTGRGISKPPSIPLKTQDTPIGPKPKSSFGNWFGKTNPMAAASFGF